eukprot:TRINITY_DN3566_c0_g1_i2.p1 TRINITY_DN3566_c0_g1~~TRINITY_DN3566_c0_g1_i2.p1  ORF type:complete len:163 (+),score=48.86 TRINITY_DN3566_c0_g1_i2:214-702(+)
MLDLFDFEVSKNENIRRSSMQDRDRYDEAHSTNYDTIETIKGDIAKLKEQLSQEKELKNNREQYKVLLKNIETYEKRAKIGEQINELIGELEELEDKSRQLDSILERRKKQFRLLMYSIKELQENIGDENLSELNFSITDSPSRKRGRDDSTEPRSSKRRKI